MDIHCNIAAKMMTPGLRDHPLVTAVRDFVEQDVRPVAVELEHADRYPHALVARMRELGLFGVLVPREYGGLGLAVTTYARIIEELCRGWMSLAGVVNSHTMAALIVLHHGTEDQRRRWLGRLAAGEARGGLCLTEPHAGSDVQAIRTRAVRRGDDYVITGTKMFVTNGREGNTFALLAVTNSAAGPRHRGMSCFIVEKGHPGLRVSRSIAKLGYKGVDTAELCFEAVPVPAANLVGGVEGRGFQQVMSGLETGRINIAARAVGVGRAAFEAARATARRRGAAPPALADMAARLGAARLLTDWAAGMKDRQERCDLEAGMAKLWASETAQGLAETALGIEGEPGALLTSAVERLYRDTPLMLIGEGTNEIQRTLIARQLVERYGERPGALVSRDGEPDERRQMVLTVRQFVDKEVTPAAADLERAARHPDDLVRALGDLGVLGALVPPALGGLGLDLVTYAMILEELGRGWTTLAWTVGAHATAAGAVARFAAPGLQEVWLPGMTRGEPLATLALDGEIAARREASAGVLDGAVPLVDNASRAALYLVLARVGDGRPALALVPRTTAGVRVGPPVATLGGRGLDPAPLTLEAARVPLAAVIDAEGAPAAARGLARLALAATALGLAQAAFEAALRYAQQRTAFGVAICQHQAVQLKLADMATSLAAARRLTYHAAERLEAGDALPAGLARLYAGQMVTAVTLESMRIHGGYGYTAEFPVERYYRDAPRLGLTLGGAEAERAELAARLAAAERD
jgi:alkylation response protein AidB-like acyl-CoA dehydrogenase